VTVCVSGVETAGCNVTVFDGRLGEGVGKCGADQTGAFIWIANSTETVFGACRQMLAASSRQAVQTSGKVLQCCRHVCTAHEFCHIRRWQL